MENTMARVLVGTVVKKTLKEIRDDPERSIRNLVDMALQFSEGRFQQNFFAVAQTMLQNENSGYYNLVRDTVACADLDRLYTFGMNLGYNGCTVGAQRIRENEKKLGCNIPWALALQIDAQRFEKNASRYDELIREGEELGIYVWTIFPTQRPQVSLSLARRHPDSAFLFFCEPTDVTPAFLACAAEAKNLMLAVRYEETAAPLYEWVRERGLLCAVWYRYGQQDTEFIINGGLFESAQQFAPIFTFLLPAADCPPAVQRLAHQAVEQARAEQTYRTVLWEMQGDTRKVDAIISEDACSAWFDKNGVLQEWNGKPKDPPNDLFASSLADILAGAYPKAPPDGRAAGTVEAG